KRIRLLTVTPCQKQKQQKRGLICPLFLHQDHRSLRPRTLRELIRLIRLIRLRRTVTQLGQIWQQQSLRQRNNSVPCGASPWTRLRLTGLRKQKRTQSRRPGQQTVTATMANATS